MNTIQRIIVVTIISLSAFLIVEGVRKSQGKVTVIEWIKNDGVLTAKEPPLGLLKKSRIKEGSVPLLAALDKEYELIANTVAPSVVSIDTQGRKPPSYLRRGGKRILLKGRHVTGHGSGVIVTRQGHIITNFHVITGKQKLRVTLHDGSEHEAKVLGYEASTDIAVLKINTKKTLFPIKFGDSDKVSIGHNVMGFGDPFDLGQSVTNGIISAKKRIRSDTETNLFQTNVAINPGNSGGPLVNKLGELIGINSSIFSTDRNSPSFQGISFAIPSNIVKKIFHDIQKYKRSMRRYLGIYYFPEGEYANSLKKKLKYSGKGGIIVEDIELDSPAHTSGIRPYDILIAYNKKPIKHIDQLINELQNYEIGKPITFQIWRKGKQLNLITSVSLLDPNIVNLNNTKENFEAYSGIERTIGIQASTFGRNQGAIVRSVRPESLSDERILPGDIIYRINNNRIYNHIHLMSIFVKESTQNDVKVYIYRNGKKLDAPVILPQINRT